MVHQYDVTVPFPTTLSTTLSTTFSLYNTFMLRLNSLSYSLSYSFSLLLSLSTTLPPSLSLTLFLSISLFLPLCNTSLGAIYVTFNGLDPSPSWVSKGLSGASAPDLYCVAHGGSTSKVAVTAGTLGAMYKTTDGGEIVRLVYVKGVCELQFSELS